MKRLFIAIKIHPQNTLVNLVQSIKMKLKNEKINWINLNNFHLTLKFIGETSETKIVEIENKIEKICNLISPFNIQLSGIGIFGSTYNPKVIWCGTNNSIVLSNLANEVHCAMDKIGFPIDRQNFVPHITLARIKKIDNKNILLNEIKPFRSTLFQEVNVNELILFESILKKSGAEYYEISKFKL